MPVVVVRDSLLVGYQDRVSSFNDAIGGRLEGDANSEGMSQHWSSRQPVPHVTQWLLDATVYAEEERCGTSVSEGAMGTTGDEMAQDQPSRPLSRSLLSVAPAFPAKQ